jgi:hypothetical protein
MKSFSVILPFSQDGQPTQPCLRAFQNEHLKEFTIIMEGDTPIFIVVAYVKRICTAPFTSLLHCLPHDRVGVPVSFRGRVKNKNRQFLFHRNRLQAIPDLIISTSSR